LIAAGAKRRQPRILLVDVLPEDGMDAIEFAAEFVSRSPSSRVMIWTDTAVGRSKEVLPRAGGRSLGEPHRSVAYHGGRLDYAPLTPAEKRVAVLVARSLERGMTVERIARSTSTNTETLRTHLRRIYIKWEVHHQAAFVAEARRQGLC
jgi:DNA-binding CsgD family transcriptional regulator